MMVSITISEQTKATRSGLGPSDAALVVAARAQEMWAKEALFRRHGRMLNGLVFRLVGPKYRDDVEDHVQEAFCSSFESLASLRDPQAYSSFLCSIAVRLVYRSLRRRKLRERLGFGVPSDREVEDVVSATAPPDVAAELRAVFRTLSRLSAKEQVVLVLRRVEGHTIDEIVSLTGMSAGTVKRKLARAQILLEEVFEGGTP